MIGRLTTLARPYALAAFEYAEEKKALSSWENFLMNAASVANNPAMANLLGSPMVTPSQIGKLFCDVLASMLDKEKTNFIHLLAEKNRFDVLPEIAELFKTYKEAYEKIISVKVTSAKPLDEKMKNKIKEALTKRLRQEIELECETDTSLIGGAIINTEGFVLDGSVKGSLERLRNSLSA